MRLKVLGSGSSGNCYILEDKQETLLLECGIPYKEILKGLDFNISNVVGCLVSHEHKDHSKALNDIIKDGIDIYTSQGTGEACGACGFHMKHIKSEQQTQISSFTILPFQTEHDAVEPLGFLIQHPGMGKLLFITDSYYCKYSFTGLNHIMIECNYSKEILEENIENGSVHPVVAKRLLKSHFSLQHVKEFLKATDLTQCKDIILIHLSSGNANAKEFQREVERLTGKPVYIAEKGLEMELMP